MADREPGGRFGTPHAPLAVRPAEPADVASVAALELEAFPEDAWRVDYLDEAVAGRLPTVRLLVAVTPAGTVVGHAILSVVYEVAELQRIATAARYRRRGVGGVLLAAVLATATAEGAERLLLEVREGNTPATALYAAGGFTEIDRRPRYYADGTTAVVLQRDL
ncbi:MAG: GNAT family N-acetyltransferase [Nocardioides sp.]|uniref:GNAT family N-acetyltransferase n=1 Tax=Nocardioides sp. TaxID=35761 RepID=UPI0039E40142